MTSDTVTNLCLSCSKLSKNFGQTPCLDPTSKRFDGELWVDWQSETGRESHLHNTFCVWVDGRSDGVLAIAPTYDVQNIMQNRENLKVA